MTDPITVISIAALSLTILAQTAIVSRYLGALSERVAHMQRNIDRACDSMETKIPRIECEKNHIDLERRVSRVEQIVERRINADQ